MAFIGVVRGVCLHGRALVSFGHSVHFDESCGECEKVLLAEGFCVTRDVEEAVAA